MTDSTRIVVLPVELGYPSVETNHSVPPTVSPFIRAGGMARNWDKGVDWNSTSDPESAWALSIDSTLMLPSLPKSL